ncbi:MAG TPA: lipid-binding SYLF domain-containing protein [Solirubrobacterales bacterium]|nr:lipid-binding SYLF domain-containing protein [Solirubrobacterales bacterium]
MLNRRTVAVLLALALTIPLTVDLAVSASPAEIDREVDFALARLFDSVPNAKPLSTQAKGVLVFPSIVKAGFLFGAQYGEGALRRQGRTVGYYNTVAASYGFQAGIQSFGYALFFMSDSALRYLDTSGGFELGTGPSLVILDAGAARALTTTTMQNDIYAVFFDQRGLMGGAGVQGSKITRIAR